MHRGSLVLIVLAGCGRLGFGEPGSEGDSGVAARRWEHRKSLQIDVAQITGAQDLIDFPLLVSTTDSDLRSVANGGTLHDSLGRDLVFTGDDMATPLAFEIERYEATTGELIAWVRVPVVSPSGGATLYLYTGDPQLASSLEQREAVWSASYAGVWHMGETGWNGTSGEVADSMGRSSGTATPGATTTQGLIGSGGSFGATSINVDVGADASLLSASITVSAWANPQSVGSAPDRHPYMVRQDYWRMPGSDPRGYYMEIYRTQTDPRPTFYTGNASTYAHAFATTNVQNGTWYYVVGTRDAASGVTRIYVDGVEEGNATMTGGIQYLPNSVFLGGYDFECWDGLLDEVRISSVARSADWIRAEYNNQRSPETFVKLGVLESL